MTELTHPGSASEWMARLSEEPENSALRRDHDAWLSLSAENRADWEETLHVWHMLEMTIPVYGAEWEHHLQGNTPQQDRISTPQHLRPHEIRGRKHERPASFLQAGRTHRFATWRQTSIGVSVAAALACLLVVFLPGWVTQFEADYTTATRETRVIALPDGSTLHLGPQSAVSLNFADQRQVTLLEGEAFFEVEPMKDAPFIVTASDVETTVLGTAFNVRRGAFGVDIAVEHGHVRVNGPTMAQGADLRAGDVAHIAPNGQTTRQTVSPALVASWRNGKLIAKDQAFAEMIETVDRYFDGWVVITDPDLARTPLTGFYDLADPKAALKVMADAQGATIQEISPWVVLVSPR